MTTGRPPAIGMRGTTLVVTILALAALVSVVGPAQAVHTPSAVASTPTISPTALPMTLVFNVSNAADLPTGAIWKVLFEAPPGFTLAAPPAGQVPGGWEYFVAQSNATQATYRTNPPHSPSASIDPGQGIQFPVHVVGMTAAVSAEGHLATWAVTTLDNDVTNVESSGDGVTRHTSATTTTDTLMPVITGVQVSPAFVGPQQEATITITTSEPIHPTLGTVSFAGRTATRGASSGLTHTFTVTPQAGDPEGPATVVATLHDLARNPGSTTQTVATKVDTTPPTLVELSRTPAANANGWNAGDVVVKWTCTDALSGPATPTASATVTGEGAALEAAGTCLDLAGNEGAVTATDVKIDRTAPTGALLERTPPNAEHWNHGDVVVSWTCTDGLSGPVAATVTSTVTAEGENLEATSSCLDLAGNSGPVAEGDIDIDRTIPALVVATRTAANAHGWNGGDVTVTWTCIDALSTVRTGPTDVTVVGPGAPLSATATCEDIAGNVATSVVSDIKIDRTAPAIAFLSQSPQPSATGWNKGDVIVTWACTDALSGPVSATVFETIAGTGTGLSAAGVCVDRAGHSSLSNTYSGVKIDRAPPTITLLSRPAAPGTGWFRGDVTVTWTCADAASGVPATQASATLTADGHAQTATGVCADHAGNTATNAQTGIHIDRTSPTAIVSARTPANAQGWNTGDVTVTWSCIDPVSGPAAPSVTKTLAGEGAALVASATCADIAGNAATVTESVRIDRAAPGSDWTYDPAPADGLHGWFVTPTTLKILPADDVSGVASVLYCLDTANACTPTTTYTGPIPLPENARRARYVVHDHAGLVAPLVSVEVRVDLTPPSVHLQLVPATPTLANGWYTAPPTLSIVASDGGSGLQAGSEGWSTNNLSFASAKEFLAPQGENVITVRARDNAGTYRWVAATVKVDSIPPTAALSRSALSTGVNTLQVLFSERMDETSPVLLPQGWTGEWNADRTAYNVTTADLPRDATLTILVPKTALDAHGLAVGQDLALRLTTPLSPGASRPAPSGPPGDTTPVPVANAPSAPQSLLGSHTDGAITLTWAAPASHGGSAITGYVVSRDGVELGRPVATTWVDDDVSDGHVYTYTVRALNAAGASPAVAASVASQLPPPTAAAQTTPAQPNGDAGWFTSETSVRLSARPGALIRYQLDDGAEQAYGAPIVVPPGLHLIRYHAEQDGKAGPTRTLHVNVDPDAPLISALNVQPTELVAGVAATLRLDIAVSDGAGSGLARVVARLVGPTGVTLATKDVALSGATLDATIPVPATLATGAYRVIVEAMDAAGNRAERAGPTMTVAAPLERTTAPTPDDPPADPSVRTSEPPVETKDAPAASFAWSLVALAALALARRRA